MSTSLPNNRYFRHFFGARNMVLCGWIIALLHSDVALAQTSQTDELEAEQLYTSQPPLTPELARPGPFAVGVNTHKLTNADQVSAQNPLQRQDRILTVEVWYPAEDPSAYRSNRAVYQDQTRSGKPFKLAGQAWRRASLPQSAEEFPLVILSHGYTGYRSQFYFLAEHLASHGYVVASIDHTDSTNADVDFATDPNSGFFSTLLNRARDQQFVLEAMAASRSPYASIVDANRSALIGYSMGGYGALNTVGGCYKFPQPLLANLAPGAEQQRALAVLLDICHANRSKVDSRWKAVVPIAPWGGEAAVHDPESLATVTTPSLVIAGELDDVSGYENGVKKLFQQLGSKDKYLLVFENARHNIGSHPPPKVAYDNELDIGHYAEPAWRIETINRVNQHLILAFLNCFVKNQTSGCDFLPQRESSDQLKQADGSLTPPWPGFPPRWATGMRFIRAGD